MAAIFCSSVWGLLKSDRVVTLSGNFPCEFTFETDDSALYEFLGLCGILPVTYLAAPPRPGFRAGSRFAMTVVDRGIIEVSSSNSMPLSAPKCIIFEPNIGNLPSLVSSEDIRSSKSVPSPRWFRAIISLFNSKTEIPVPSKTTRDGSFWDLNRKYTEEDMVEGVTGGEDVEVEDASKYRTQERCYREIEAIFERDNYCQKYVSILLSSINADGITSALWDIGLEVPSLHFKTASSVFLEGAETFLKFVVAWSTIRAV